jgi:hypothetical protein
LTWIIGMAALASGLIALLSDSATMDVGRVFWQPHHFTFTGAEKELRNRSDVLLHHSQTPCFGNRHALADLYCNQSFTADEREQPDSLPHK